MHAGLSWDVLIPFWSSVVSPCRTHLGCPHQWGQGFFCDTLGHWKCHEVGWGPASLLCAPHVPWPALCWAQGNVVRLSQASHTCSPETASYLDFTLDMRDGITLLPTSCSSSEWLSPHPHLRNCRERVQAVRMQCPCVRPPHLNSRDFLSHNPKPQPRRQAKPFICSWEPEALL